MCVDATPVRGGRHVSDHGGPGPETKQAHIHTEGEE